MRRFTTGFLVATGLVVLVAGWPTASASSIPATPPVSGAVVWYDLLIEDGESVLDFYEGLFGWEIVPHGDDGWVVLHHGRPIAGISEISNDHPKLDEGTWIVGVAVNDVDAAVATATKLGAKRNLGPDELPGFARYAVISDLEGAPLLLVDPRIDMSGGREHGAFVWTELWSQDPSSAAAFYGEVIGYQRKEIQVDNSPYVVFETSNASRAGLVRAPFETIEPAWVPYVGVEELAAATEQVKKLGGRIVVEPNPDFSNGSVALITDPGGAAFFIYEIGGLGEVTE